MKSRIARIILLLLLVAKASIVFSQFSQPFLRKIGKNEGLTGSLVLSIIQDSRNIYWIGTINGLQQFDGKVFKKFPLPQFQDGSYGSNSISNLLIADDSTLWISNYQGIAKFNIYTHTFKLIHVPKESPTQSIAFTSLIKDNNSNIYASSFEMGLIKYNRKTNAFEKHSSSELTNLKRLKVQASANSNELMLLHKKGIAILETTSLKIIEKPQPNTPHSWISNECFKGEIYDLIQTDNYIYSLIWNHKKVKYDLLQYDKKKSACKIQDFNTVAGRKFFKDSNQNIWIYGDGIDVIPNGTNELVTIKENIKEGRQIDFTMCHKMFEDNEHNIWFCTNAGLFVFNINERNFKICNETDENGYVKHMYNSFQQLQNNEIWIGTFGEGLLILDSTLHKKKHINFEEQKKDKHYNLIWNIYESNLNKEIWLGCQKGRLIKYNQLANEFIYYNDEAFEGKTIMSIAEDDSGNIYFGTNGGAIITKKKNKEGFSVFYKSEQLSSRTAAGEIKHILFIDGQLVAATQYDGIIVLNTKTKKATKYNLDLNNPKALKSNNIFCLLNNGDGNYFTGTSNGLGYYKKETNGFEFYTMSDGLPFSNVYDLIAIDKQQMVASTSDGLYKINWDLKSFERVEKNATLYKGFNFTCRIKNENNLILGDDEYLYLLPIVNDQKKKLPISNIYSIRSFDKSYFIYKQNETILFDKNHNTVNIDFGASSFNYYNSIDYYYLLEGIDNDWVSAENSRTITYNNLKGGSYNLKIKSVFQEDKKQTQLLSINFEIEKPFNQRSWFYLLIIGVLGGLFYLFYRIRLNKLLAIEKIRFDLSKDLHDDMGSTLSTINILSVMAESKIEQGNSSSKQYLKRINQISQEMMQNMDDIVWSINPNNDNIDKVVVRMREFAAEILEPLNINLQFKVENIVNDLDTKMRWRRDFYLIFKEAINNAAKYSNCKNIQIHISIKGKGLRLLIEDDGKGFDLESNKSGNGLTNMRNRAKDIGAEISINSKPNEGTHIQLFVPLNKI